MVPQLVYIRKLLAIVGGLACAIPVAVAQHSDLLTETPLRDTREIKVTSGTAITEGQYPFLTAVLSGRSTSLQVAGASVNAAYFGASTQRDFSGELVDCGFATSFCDGVAGKVCAIIFDFPFFDIPVLSPANQLKNCRDSGGIAAIYRPNSEGYFDRFDLTGDQSEIPAVYVYDTNGYHGLLEALSGDARFIAVTGTVPERIHCGGTYLGGAWVLTAAHCVIEESKDGPRTMLPQELLVNVGAHGLNTDKEYVQAVVEIIVGGYRTSGSFAIDDYALLRLDSVPVRGQAVNMVSEETLKALAVDEAPALVLGWGRTQVREPLVVPGLAQSSSNVPLAAVLKLRTNDVCQIQWNDFLQTNSISNLDLQLTDSHVCAAYLALNRDTCQGDSGGPLLVNVGGELQVAGVTSFGLGCGSVNGVPGVYARTPSFSQWVYNKTGLSSSDRDRTAFMVASDTFALKTSGGGYFGFTLMGLAALLVCFKRPYRGRRRTGLLAVLLCLGGCSADQSGKATDLTSQPAIDTLEKIDATVVSDQAISATVVSTGCTRADHFDVEHRMDEVCTLIIHRRQPDLCKRSAEAVVLQLPWTLPAACASRQLVFANPRLTDD